MTVSWRVLRLRLWRGFVLACAVMLLRGRAESDAAPAAVAVEAVLEWFPAAVRITPPDGETGAQYVTDQFGDALGLVLRTLPRARDIVGYSGPNDTLLAVDRNGSVLGARLLSSGDTVDHVRRVLESKAYWESLKRLPGEPESIRAVSGATLTSSAITRGVLRALGAAERISLLFPFPLELAEARRVFPEAVELLPESGPPGGVQVLDGTGTLLGRILRTSPESDPVIGYKGPTDTLVVLDPEGTVVRELRVRESYETEEYLAVVTNDSRFLPSFAGRTVEDLANFDARAEGVSGVSGATRTSLAILEGVRRRLAATRLDHSPRIAIRFGWKDGMAAAIVLGGIGLAFSSARGLRGVRLAWQALLIGYLGLVAGDLVSQSLILGWASQGVPWRELPGLALLAGSALLVPLGTGRQLYCHHVCPHGAAQMWLGKLTRRKVALPPQVTRWLSRLPAALLGLLFLLVVGGSRVNPAAWEPFDAWVFRASGLASILLAVAGLTASVFHPLAYCRFGCPTGALLKFLRTGGSQDRFGPRDWAALALLAAGVAVAAGPAA